MAENKDMPEDDITLEEAIPEDEDILEPDEITKAIALELLADHPEEERRLVEAMPASCIAIDRDGEPVVLVRSIASVFNLAARRGRFDEPVLSDEEYTKLLEDVNMVSPFQGVFRHGAPICTPEFMVTLVTAYGKSRGEGEPFEAGFEFLKPRLENIRKYL
jgi:PAS domain-containing protein